MSLDSMLTGTGPPQSTKSPPTPTEPSPKMTDLQAVLTATKILSTGNAGTGQPGLPTTQPTSLASAAVPSASPALSSTQSPVPPTTTVPTTAPAASAPAIATAVASSTSLPTSTPQSLGSLPSPHLPETRIQDRPRSANSADRPTAMAQAHGVYQPSSGPGTHLALSRQIANAQTVETSRNAYREHVQTFRLVRKDLPSLDGQTVSEVSHPPGQPHVNHTNYADPGTARPYTVQNIMGGKGFNSPAVPAASTKAYLDLVAECNDLHEVLSTVSEKAARRVIRDLWEKTLVGSDHHTSFVLNAAMDKCTGSSARIAVTEFGGKLVHEARREILQHFTPEMVEELGDVILERAPGSFFDKAMQRRLETIAARPLLNMLARAERLGYDVSDITPDEPPASHPTVQPIRNSAPQPPYTPAPSAPSAPTLAGSATAIPMDCPFCGRGFTSTSARDHHIKKQVCRKPVVNVKYICEHCGQSFSTAVGLQYHTSHAVCQGAEPVAASPQGNPVVISSGETSPEPNRPNMTMMLAQPTQPKQPTPRVAPLQPSTGEAQSGVSALETSTPPRVSMTVLKMRPYSSQVVPQASPPARMNISDPYAHLAPEVRRSLEADLKQVEEIFAAKFKEAHHIEDPAQREHRLDSLQNQLATRQSQTRGRYGVKLRTRRSRAAINEERTRIGAQQGRRTGFSSPDSTAASTPDGPALKKARVSDGAGMGASAALPTKYESPVPVPQARKFVPTPVEKFAPRTPTRKRTSVSAPSLPEAGSGMVSTNAVPATVDPTRSSLPGTNTTTYTQGRSVVTVYPAPEPASRSSHQAKNGSSGTPIKSMLKPTGPLSDSDSKTEKSDSDSDDEIPAELPPPPRASGNTPRCP